MSASLQNKVTVELKKEDIKDNLLKILEEMSRLRNECIANLESTNQQKTDYLKLTCELASCVDALIKENNLDEQVDKIMNFVKNDQLLKCYDVLQDNFWKETNKTFLDSLSDLNVYLLGDDFSSTTHSYHLFQVLKYLKLDEDKLEVIKTILPINNLLNNSSSSPTLNKFLIERFVGNKTGESGIGIDKTEGIGLVQQIENLEKMGVLYVELPARIYENLQNVLKGKKAIKREQKTIVVLAKEETTNARNTFKEFQNYAQLNLGEKEDNLVLKISNYYYFGEEFFEELKNKINPKKAETEDSESLEEIIYLEETAADGGSSKTQGDWAKYGKKNQKLIASASDIYKFFKQIKEDLESNNAEKIRKAELLKQSCKNDISSQSSLITSTRLYHTESSIMVTDHHDCSKPELNTQKKYEGKYGVNSTNSLMSFSENSNYHNFLKLLLNTNDSVEEITSVFSKISDIPGKYIILHFGDYYNNRERAVRFGLVHENYPASHFAFSIHCSSQLSGSVGKARILQKTKPEIKESKENQIYSVIDKENSCVYFTNLQKINDHTKLTGLFCYNQERYVVSIIKNNEKNNNKETALAKILSQSITTEEKIKQIEETISPTYAHLVKYQLKNDSYKEIDDVEVFKK